MVASHGMAGVGRQRICSEMHVNNPLARSRVEAWRLSDALSQCLSPEVPLGLARHAASGGEERERGDPPPPLLPPSLPGHRWWVTHSKRECWRLTDCEEFPPPTFFLTNFASFFGSFPPACSVGTVFACGFSPLAPSRIMAARCRREREREERGREGRRGMAQETNE